MREIAYDMMRTFLKKRNLDWEIDIEIKDI